MRRTPYEDTQVSAARSKDEIERIFARYGVERFATIQHGPGEFEISFFYRTLPVRLPFSAEGLLQALLKEQPWTSRRQSSRDEYTEKLRAQAAKSVWRHAAHYLKATFEAVHYGILTFEQAFLHGFATPSGRTLGQLLIPQLPDVSSGLLALPEPIIEQEYFDAEG